MNGIVVSIKTFCHAHCAPLMLICWMLAFYSACERKGML